MQIEDGTHRGQAADDDLRFCLYARKSSEADEKQALSIDSQITEMDKIAREEQLNIVETLMESKSAKSAGERKVYNELITGLQEGKYNAILTWAPDRLSRNAGDLGSIVDLMDDGKLLQIRTHGQTFTNNPNEKFLLMILGSQAKLENDNRAKNVRRGLRKKCEMGVRPGAVPLGYQLKRGATVHEKSTIELDPLRAPFIKQMFTWVAEDNYGGRRVWDDITTKGLRSKSGKRLTLSMVYRILENTFYYGEFEYPKGSGNVYQGNYEAIISKELYETVREKMKVPDKGVWGRKSFYFNKVLRCGTCGSGISGEEKIKANGKRYVYYRCNRQRGSGACSECMIEEEDIISQITDIIIDVAQDSDVFDNLVHKRVKKWNEMEVLRKGDKAEIISPYEYVSCIMRGKSVREKSVLVKGLGERLVLRDKEVVSV